MSQSKQERETDALVELVNSSKSDVKAGRVMSPEQALARLKRDRSDK
ncbi:hypothetical protein EniLVp02_0159 [Vibrio phage EniLVp02]